MLRDWGGVSIHGPETLLGSLLTLKCLTAEIHPQLHQKKIWWLTFIGNSLMFQSSDWKSPLVTPDPWAPHCYGSLLGHRIKTSSLLGDIQLLSCTVRSTEFQPFSFASHAWHTPPVGAQPMSIQAKGKDEEVEGISKSSAAVEQKWKSWRFLNDLVLEVNMSKNWPMLMFWKRKWDC